MTLQEWLHAPDARALEQVDIRFQYRSDPEPTRTGAGRVEISQQQLSRPPLAHIVLRLTVPYVTKYRAYWWCGGGTLEAERAASAASRRARRPRAS